MDCRSLINNDYRCYEGFTKVLELVGVGYRASNQGTKLICIWILSHNIVSEIAPEVTFRNNI
jgi:large subunit ribosomal protein L6